MQYKITISIQCHMDYGAIIYLKRVSFVLQLQQKYNSNKWTRKIHAQPFTTLQDTWGRGKLCNTLYVYILQWNPIIAAIILDSLIFWWKCKKSFRPTTTVRRIYFSAVRMWCIWLFDLCFKSHMKYTNYYMDMCDGYSLWNDHIVAYCTFIHILSLSYFPLFKPHLIIYSLNHTKKNEKEGRQTDRQTETNELLESEHWTLNTFYGIMQRLEHVEKKSRPSMLISKNAKIVFQSTMYCKLCLMMVWWFAYQLLFGIYQSYLFHLSYYRLDRAKSKYEKSYALLNSMCLFRILIHSGLWSLF